MSQMTPKITLIIIILLLIVNIPLAIIAAGIIITGLDNSIFGYILIGVLVLIDFIILTLISQLHSSA